jgi:hypothetical protein
MILFIFVLTLPNKMELKCQFFKDFIYLLRFYSFVKLDMFLGTKLTIEVKHPCMFKDFIFEKIYL